jgi:hypothetical protein
MSKEIRIPKRETTQTKIDLARDALRAVGINYHVPIYRNPRIKDGLKAGPLKGTDTIPISNKMLCGQLGHLCKELRAHNIPYPWREE